MATYKNYSISSSKGKLYLKEKAPKEGYEEILYGVNKDKKTYHKYEDSVQGKPKSFEVREAPFEGRTLRFLEFVLQDGDTENQISLPLKNKNGYTDEVKAIVSSLNDIDVSEIVTLTPKISKYKNKAGVEKEQINIYINYVNKLGENGKGLPTGYIPFAEIPKAEKEVDEDDGDITWNWKPVNKFYARKIKEIGDKFESKPKETAEKVKEPVVTKRDPDIEEEDPDDLPF